MLFGRRDWNAREYVSRGSAKDEGQFTLISNASPFLTRPHQWNPPNHIETLHIRVELVSGCRTRVHYWSRSHQGPGSGAGWQRQQQHERFGHVIGHGI